MTGISYEKMTHMDTISSNTKMFRGTLFKINKPDNILNVVVIVFMINIIFTQLTIQQNFSPLVTAF